MTHQDICPIKIEHFEKKCPLLTPNQIVDLGHFDVPAWIDIVGWIAIVAMIFLAGFVTGQDWGY